MHPLFGTLFLEPETDDLLVREEEKRRHAKVARREPSRRAMKVGARGKDRHPRR
jgi:hypothetical protein